MRKKMLATVSTAAFTVGLVGGFSSLAFADQQTSGSGGVASGNQINVPVDIEAGLCGNSLAALGISKAQCAELSRVLYASSDAGKTAAQQSSGSGGVASGNQINIPVNAAVDVCGNSIGVLGISKADCTKIVEEIADSPKNEQQSSGSGGVASGNQINIPVNIAVDVCGNSIGVLGISKADCTKIVDVIQTSPENEENDTAQESSGSGGVASGNQINIPVNAAADVCGNAVSVLGLSEAECLEKITTEKKDTENPGTPESEKPKDPKESTEEPEESKESDGPKKQDGPKKTEEDGKKEEPAGGDDKKPAAGGNLPVTGAALGGLIAVSIAALGGGGAAMYFSRKKKAAALSSEN